MGICRINKFVLFVLLGASPSLPNELTGSSIITTYAGAGWIFSGDRTPGNAAALSSFNFLATDNSGNILFADSGNQVVTRLNSDGTLSVLAGNGIRGYSGNGAQARSVALTNPTSAVTDSAGNLYIYDGNSYRIRRVSPDGVISTYAGTGAAGTSVDGVATDSPILTTGAMAMDASGALYFTQPGLSVVRR